MPARGQPGGGGQRGRSPRALESARRGRQPRRVSGPGAAVPPVGDAALTVELGRTLEPSSTRRVRAWTRRSVRSRSTGLLESVPAYASLLCVYDPARASFGDARGATSAFSTFPRRARGRGRATSSPYATAARTGPTSAEVARARPAAKREVIQRHTAAEYTALFVGFLPGFAYLGTLDAELEMPRRAAPRPRARGQRGHGRPTHRRLPFASPGGWNLIGRTERVLFDPFASEPALIRPGIACASLASDLPVDADYPRTQPFGHHARHRGRGRRAAHDRAGRRTARPSPAGRAVVRLPGSTGRARREPRRRQRGERRPPRMHGRGPTLHFHAATRFAVTGSRSQAVLERADLGPWPVPNWTAVVARPGNDPLHARPPVGLRAYIAFAGGVTVPEVLGSRSTDLVAGFGGYDGRALKANDHLSLGRAPAAEGGGCRSAPRRHRARSCCARWQGPQDDMFTDEARAGLEAETYAVSARSPTAIGCRLEDPCSRTAPPARS